MTIQEFAMLEVVIGAMDTTSEDVIRLGRFNDGELGLAIDRNGERGVLCRLGDWQ